MVRNIVFTWLRPPSKIETARKAPYQVLSTRRFVRLDTAIPRAVQLLILQGQPGDVIELAHHEHGFQIATIKIHSGGKFNIQISKELQS